MTTSDAQECVTKVCTKCGEIKPIEYFSKGKKQKFTSVCKKCAAKKAKEFRQKNSGYHAYSKEKRREYARQYYKDNRNKLLIQQKEQRDIRLRNGNFREKTYRLENAEKRRAATKDWQIKNPEKNRLKTRRDIARISDSYVAKFFRISVHDLDASIIELKRIQIKYHRYVVEQKQIVKEISNAK